MSDQDNRELESTNLDEELELEHNQDDTEDVEELKLKLEEAREANRKINARAKKAEEQLKQQASQPVASETPKPTQLNSTLTANDIDTRVLKATGMSDEMLEQLTKVATVTGKSLFEAQSDEIFIALKEKKDAETRAEKARLGASRGSGSVRKEKSLNTPGLTAAEHKELWRNSNG